LPVVYVADGSGGSTGTVQIETGLSLSELDGKAFVLHEITGGRIACGLLGAAPPPPPEFRGVIDLGAYPGYAGSLTVSGTVSIFGDPAATTHTYVWDLSGVDPACTANAGAESGIGNGCGIHVHSGTSCSDATQVGGHYFSTAADPWSLVTYVSDSSGRSHGSVEVDTGKTLAELSGRAFVIHLQSGAR